MKKPSKEHMMAGCAVCSCAVVDGDARSRSAGSGCLTDAKRALEALALSRDSEPEA
jgi:hypothetical protein